MSKESDLTPNKLDDIVFGNEQAKIKLKHLINGDIPFPAVGKCGILLYGVWGTGKTTLAKMIPQLIEATKSGGPAFSQYNQCTAGINGPAMINNLDQRTSFMAWNASGIHYEVLDEVDNLTDAAQLHLKAVMNRSDVVYVLTTNHITKVEKGVQNRCHLIEMNAGKPEQWLPMCQKVIAASGALAVSDDVLLPMIESCNGSAREIVTRAMHIGIERAKQAA